MQAVDSSAGEAKTHPYPQPSSLPKTLTRSFQILSVDTDIFVQIFSDRIFFGVSQLDGKIGSYLLCEAETSEANLKHTEYHLSTLLGNREDSMLGVYARTLHERIRAFPPLSDQETSKPSVILLGISLDKDKGAGPKMFRSVLDVLVDAYVDAVKEK